MGTIICSPLIAQGSLHGELLHKVIVCSPLKAEVTLLGNALQSVLVTCTPLRAQCKLILGSDKTSSPLLPVLIIPSQDNLIGWSKIGDFKFLDIASRLGAEYIADDLVNDAGYWPVNWMGWVYKILPLSENFVVYGQNGITSMTFASATKAVAPTYGFKTISNIGLLTKESVCGDSTRHFFIDRMGRLGKVTAESLNFLGFEEFLLPMGQKGVPVLLNLDAARNTLYISNGLEGYSLNLEASPETLSGGYKGLTSLVYISGTAYGSGSLAQSNVKVKTEVIDLKTRREKVLKTIEVSCSSPLYLQCRIHYRVDSRKPFSSTEWSSLNSQGRAFFNLTFTEMQLEIQSTQTVNVSIDDVFAEIIAPDGCKFEGAEA